jgi:hypothetical protein
MGLNVNATVIFQCNHKEPENYPKTLMKWKSVNSYGLLLDPVYPLDCEGDMEDT